VKDTQNKREKRATRQREKMKRCSCCAPRRTCYAYKRGNDSRPDLSNVSKERSEGSQGQGWSLGATALKRVTIKKQNHSGEERGQGLERTTYLGHAHQLCIEVKRREGGPHQSYFRLFG